MGRKSRGKGKRGELEAAKALGEALGINMRRSVQYSGRNSGEADLSGLEGISVEVKRSERFQVYDAMEQSSEAAEKTGDIPMVLHRRNRKPWIAIFYLEDLPRAAEKLERLHRTEDSDESLV